MHPNVVLLGAFKKKIFKKIILRPAQILRNSTLEQHNYSFFFFFGLKNNLKLFWLIIIFL